MHWVSFPVSPRERNLEVFLENWRQKTLLNSLYTIYSRIWANCSKSYLPKLIGSSQTGFVQVHFIGENTRVTFDILLESITDNSEIFLILIDFEKAFDVISWEFISKIVHLFNLIKKIVEVVKSLQKNASDLINLQRGSKQGDLISPYIFVLALEFRFLSRL